MHGNHILNQKSSKRSRISTHKTLLTAAHTLHSLLIRRKTEESNIKIFTEALGKHAWMTNTRISYSVLFLIAYVFKDFAFVFQLDAVDAQSNLYSEKVLFFLTDNFSYLFGSIFTV